MQNFILHLSYFNFFCSWSEDHIVVSTYPKVN